MVDQTVTLRDSLIYHCKAAAYMLFSNHMKKTPLLNSDSSADQNEPFVPYEKIVPAVMASSFADAEEKITRVKGLVKWVQIDTMDSRFTDSISWPYMRKNGAQPEFDEDFMSIMNEADGLPCWEDFDFEIDLMVSDPATAAEHWASAGATRVIFHIHDNAATADKPASNNIETIRAAIDVAVARGLQISVAVLPQPCPPSPEVMGFIWEIAPKLSGIQCMGIDHIGHQHEKFNPAVIDMVRMFRKEIDARGLAIELSVDGGVSFETAGRLFEAGASYLVAGSAVYDADSVIQALDHFAEISGE